MQDSFQMTFLKNQILGPFEFHKKEQQTLYRHYRRNTDQDKYVATIHHKMNGIQISLLETKKRVKLSAYWKWLQSLIFATEYAAN